MPARKRSDQPAAPAADPFDLPNLDRVDVTVGPGGRIVIPAAFRAALGIKEGDRLMARVVDGELRMMTPEMGIRWAQAMVRRMIPPGVSLVDELLAERRREVELEEREFAEHERRLAERKAGERNG